MVLFGATRAVLSTFNETDSEGKKYDVVTLLTKSFNNPLTVDSTKGNLIRLNVDYLQCYRGDIQEEFVGVVYHEMTHVWQWTGNGMASRGLINGIADYVRLKSGHAFKGWPRKGSGSRWDDDSSNNSTTLHYHLANLTDNLPEWFHSSSPRHTNGWYDSKKKEQVMGFGWYRYWPRRNRNGPNGEDDFQSIDEGFEQSRGPKKYSFGMLTMATNNFAGARLLGEGGFGRVYEGQLADVNASVAIKRITPESKQGPKEYATEVRTIRHLKHKNLVELIGWCHERNEFLLVYELMSNGSLDSHLFKEKTPLTWEKRYSIAKGIALGLKYLHEDLKQCVVHRDIKSSNVLLDSEFNAKLGDFGLARIVDHVKAPQTTLLAGTMGYLAPECIYTGKASKESDVYSFGVVLLEIACGRKVIESRAPEDQVQLVRWVWELNGVGKLKDAVDPKLGKDFDVSQMERLMITGLCCAHPDPKVRPPIGRVLTFLNFDASPPVLPSKLPVPTYLAPPSLPIELLNTMSSQKSCSSSSAFLSNEE
ncbi:L-type lectin-domain containing receptor kinase IX.1-like [Eucalyptus grandis]|uniref:L-type lectin-domain containing receptor kinase IX.1-like n=1 Tax=Eucalyptus grandis TaxID=71139 RepID=UPI00192EEF85|nr:L-type lectin-domain containing receptor kinase IX.1-like [Eucalyptus grandis]